MSYNYNLNNEMSKIKRVLSRTESEMWHLLQLLLFRKFTTCSGLWSHLLHKLHQADLQERRKTNSMRIRQKDFHNQFSLRNSFKFFLFSIIKSDNTVRNKHKLQIPKQNRKW